MKTFKRLLLTVALILAVSFSGLGAALPGTSSLSTGTAAAMHGSSSHPYVVSQEWQWTGYYWYDSKYNRWWCYYRVVTNYSDGTYTVRYVWAWC